MRLTALAILCAAVAVPLADDDGRVLDGLPSSPRLVTLAPHLAELVYAAGAGGRLVATVEYSDHPDAAASVPRIGDAFRIDLERLVAARPDIVFAWGGGTPPASIARLESAGLRVAVLRSERLEDISRHLRLIGALAGTAERADSAADDFDARLAGLRARYRDAERVDVFYQVAERPLYTIGRGHVISAAIELCGGRNVFGTLDTLAPSVGVEAVLAAAPDVMLAGVHPRKPDPGVLEMWTRWRRIPAVRDGHLYQLDASLMGRPTPRMLDGVEVLCERIDRAR